MANEVRPKTYLHAWVPAQETETITEICNERAELGWELKKVVMGVRYRVVSGQGFVREDGWLLLFQNPAMVKVLRR